MSLPSGLRGKCLIAFAVVAMPACQFGVAKAPGEPPGEVAVGTTKGGTTGGAGTTDGGKVGDAAFVSGTVLRPKTAIIANSSPLLDAALWEDAPQADAQVILRASDGREISKVRTTDAQGLFEFGEVADAVGAFFVEARFDADGKTFTWRAVASREAGAKTRTRVDVASTLVATKLWGLAQAKKIALSDIDAVAAERLVRAVRDAVSADMVPDMAGDNEDIAAAMDQLIGDVPELARLAAAISPVFAEPKEVWLASTVVTSAELLGLKLFEQAAEIGRAGSFAADPAGTVLLPIARSPVEIHAISVSEPDGRRKVSAQRFATLPAGSGGPVGVALGPENQLYVAAFQATTRELRIYRGKDVLTTPIASASWKSASDPVIGQVAIDGGGAAYVSIPSHDIVVRVSALPGQTTVFGKQGTPGGADGDAGNARFRQPTAVAISPGGSAYIADRDNFSVRVVSADGSVATLAGKSGDGIRRGGRASAARFSGPVGLAAPSSTLYIADAGANRVRRLSPAGFVFDLRTQREAIPTPTPGPTPAPTPAPSATPQFVEPVPTVPPQPRVVELLDAMAADGAGGLYVREARFDATGRVESYTFWKLQLRGP